MTWSAVAVFVMAIVWALTLAHGDGGASVLVVVGYSLTSLLAAATAVVVLQLLAFRLVDMLLTGLPQRIRDGETAAAVLLVGAKLATALILAAALTG